MKHAFKITIGKYIALSLLICMSFFAVSTTTFAEDKLTPSQELTKNQSKVVDSLINNVFKTQNDLTNLRQERNERDSLITIQSFGRELSATETERLNTLQGKDLDTRISSLETQLTSQVSDANKAIDNQVTQAKITNTNTTKPALDTSLKAEGFDEEKASNAFFENQKVIEAQRLAEDDKNNLELQRLQNQIDSKIDPIQSQLDTTRDELTNTENSIKDINNTIEQKKNDLKTAAPEDQAKISQEIAQAEKTKGDLLERKETIEKKEDNLEQELQTAQSDLENTIQEKDQLERDIKTEEAKREVTDRKAERDFVQSELNNTVMSEAQRRNKEIELETKDAQLNASVQKLEVRNIQTEIEELEQKLEKEKEAVAKSEACKGGINTASCKEAFKKLEPLENSILDKEKSLQSALGKFADAQGEVFKSMQKSVARETFDLSSIAFEEVGRKAAPGEGVRGLILDVIRYAVISVGLVAILGISIGGIMLIVAAGDENIIQNAKTTLFHSIIGLVFVILSYAIVATVQSVVYGIAS